MEYMLSFMIGAGILCYCCFYYSEIIYKELERKSENVIKNKIDFKA